MSVGFCVSVAYCATLIFTFAPSARSKRWALLPAVTSLLLAENAEWWKRAVAPAVERYWARKGVVVKNDSVRNQSL